MGSTDDVVLVDVGAGVEVVLGAEVCGRLVGVVRLRGKAVAVGSDIWVGSGLVGAAVC